MLDFVIEGHVPGWIWALYFVLILSVFIIGYKYISRPGFNFQDHNKKALIFVAFFTIFALFYCLNSDYFAYREFAYGDYKFFFINSDIKDIEAYYYVAILCNGNYELFRIIIWGGSFLIFYITCRVFKTPPYLAILLYFLLYNDHACYGRVTLAMSVFYLGLALLIKKKWFILGILIILSSVFFHHSMAVAVVLVPIIITPKNKKIQLVLYLTLFVVMYYVINRFMGEADSLMDDESLGYYGRKMVSSQNKIDDGTYSRYGSIFGVLNDLFEYLVFYIPIFGLFTIISKSKKTNMIYADMTKLYIIIVSITLLSTTFLIIYQSFNVLFYRTLYMTMIPISILMATLLSNKLIKKDFVYLTLAMAIIHYLGLYLSHI